MAIRARGAATPAVAAMRRLLALAAAALVAAAPAAEPIHYDYRVVASFPHDPEAFTQGLQYVEGVLYESTGGYGRSSVRRVAPDSGEVLALRRLPEHLFGEGLAVVGERVVQLTWRAGVGIVYDRDGLVPRERFRIPGEGWGLAYDGARLVMSDGSDMLHFLDPRTFARIGGVAVHDGERAVTRLNELEVVDGRILANVWGSDDVAEIDPDSGAVTAWIHLAGLLPLAYRRGSVDVLNGIAFDTKGQRLLVTGKNWPRLFHIELVPR